MNEIALSNNLNQIELEINHHKQIAGQSVWEIGRRLNHVKENDLAYGQFGKWLEKIKFNHSTANRLMKISREIPKSDTWQNLGERTLYLIATLPEEQKEEELKKAEGGDPSTVRELQELKKQNKQKDQQISLKEKRIQTLKQQNEDLEFKASQEPKVIEKEVTKEVRPHDYEGLKSDNRQLSQALRESRRESEKTREQLNQMIEERKEVDEKSKKYDQLTEGISELRGQMDDYQKQVTSYKRVVDTIRKGNELLDEVAGLVYVADIETLKENELASRELNKLVERVDHWRDDLKQKIDGTTIIEGEFTNG